MASSAGGTGPAVREFILPDLGEGLTEAELIGWKVAVGDEVHIDQMILEVESAKSVVELPCPFAGTVVSLGAAAGDTVEAGQVLLTISTTTPATGAVSIASPGETAGGSGANLIGYGTKEPKARSGKQRSFGGRSTVPSTAAAPPSTPVQAPAVPAQAPARTPAVSPVTSPIVRKLAQEHGISAKRLAGTGHGGTVTRADVRAAIEANATGVSAGTAPATNAAAVSTAPGATSATSVPPSSGDIRTPITGLRKVVAERLSRSRREIPEATIWLDVDATELLATKHAIEARTGAKYSLLSLVARFVIAGLKKYPIINSSIDTAANEIVTHGDINLGLAAQTPRGLMVPVVHGAGEMSLRQLRDSIADTVGKASTGTFAPSELTGGTFTLNNYGVFGVDGSAPIINLPEVAMLGLGRIKDRPWVVGGELTVRKVMYLSFVFDHRACDGAEPSAFLTFVADCIENPIALLPEV